MSDVEAADLERSAAGDESAFERFVGRHEAAVLRFLRGIAADPERAEDAFQETFLSAWRSARSFRGGEARAWLLAIARNAARRQYRRRAGEPSEHLSLMELGRRAGWGVASGNFARALEDRDRVRRAFAALEPEDREVLILRDLEGLTAREVAGTLEIGLGAAKSRIHRARLRFIDRLREVDHV